jgi:hypothetical protein
LLPTLKHVHDTTDFGKSLGDARAIAGLILSVWWMEQNYNTANAAVPSQNFIRSRNLGSLPTQMRARNKIEI